MELKLLADVALVGYPSVGKSSFINKVSAAKSKVASYHFTTLKPKLGVVRMGDEESFVIADIPGLIEGAHEGVGLGDRFLKHIERCKLIIHIVDISGIDGRDPKEDFLKINKELSNYSNKLSQKLQIVVANKIDMLYDDEKYDEYIPLIKNHLIQIIDHPELQFWKIHDAIELMLKLEPEFVHNLLEEKGKTLEDFKINTL